MKKRLKVIVVAGLFSFLLPGVVYGAEMETQEVEYGETSEYGFIPITGFDVSEEFVSSPLNRQGIYPTRFNLGEEYGAVTSVKNQGSAGLCWSFSSMAASESNLISMGQADDSLDLSEMYPAWAAYHLGEETYLSNGGWIDFGGNSMLISSALLYWNGVVDEDVAPFTMDNTASYSLGLSRKHIKNIYFHPDFYDKEQNFVESSVSAVKKRLTEGTAIDVCWLYNENRYDEATKSYYCPEFLDSNHQVAIVGWDDEKETAAENPGAWLIKNSFGDGWRDQGYAYVSYYDKTLSNPVSYEFENTQAGVHEYTKLYSHTPVSINAISALRSDDVNEVFGANVYTVSSDQQIGAAGAFFNEATNYTVRLYTGITVGADGTVDWSKKKIAAATTGYVDGGGFYTIPFDESIRITKGSSFAVAVSSGAGQVFHEGLSVTPTNRTVGRRTVSSVGQSFLSWDGGNEFDDLKVRYGDNDSRGTNLYITAYGNADGQWQNQDGTYYYLRYNGNYQTGWQKIDNCWYYFDQEGKMKSGWQKINNRWYYLGSAASGAMKTGWQKINNRWYYLGGADDGAMKTGWQKINNRWYYLGTAESGAMKTGWQKINNRWYYLGGANDGTMKTGLQHIGGKTYYLGGDNDGAMRILWQKLNGNWYYFSESQNKGYMYQNRWIHHTDGKWYYVQDDGTMAVNTWIGNYYVNQAGVRTRSR